ncbi:Rpn family recombination-promoting nuclease/putative transposase [Pedobacter sp. BS3]|uniref:Rpn family recombination-promoting nuclease/putative transposase n=1 Tax=Pedobacter sp. BS3 TaxID=2567937 RepID=UPI001F5B5002|nr:Rpn family recombination-promoting nuclease/putative transposase [Pedobacter sp. BS3]
MAKTARYMPPLIGRYIDPLTDFGFKRIFGSEPNKDLLIAILNELFQGRKIIRDLVYNPQENNGPLKGYRKTIFDLTCTGADGETFIVEVQRAEQKYFTDRAIFYTASKLHEQGPKGRKDWDYALKEVYFIGLMDFNFDNTAPDKYLHRVRLAEEETGETFYHKLGFIFLELPNFNLEEKEIQTDLDRWFYVLRNMGKLKKIPVILHKKIFQKLFRISEISNLKKEEYMLYEKSLMDKWDTYSVLKTAEERGMERGMERGKAEGKAEVVGNLITKLGLSDSKAAEVAEVPVDFVQKVRASLKKRK